jgi:hypothetical protein
VIMKYLFPLLFLVLHRHSRIIRAASRYVLHEEELIKAIMSIEVIFDAVEERIRTLQSNVNMYSHAYVAETWHQQFSRTYTWYAVCTLPCPTIMRLEW